MATFQKRRPSNQFAEWFFSSVAGHHGQQEQEPHSVDHGRPPLPPKTEYSRPPETQNRDTKAKIYWRYGGEHVFVAGNFTPKPWGDKVPLTPEPGMPGILSCSLDLKPGNSYEFKFIVDGEWKVDEGLPTTTDKNGFTNNIIRMHRPSSAQTSRQHSKNGNVLGGPELAAGRDRAVRELQGKISAGRGPYNLGCWVTNGPNVSGVAGACAAMFPESNPGPDMDQVKFSLKNVVTKTRRSFKRMLGLENCEEHPTGFVSPGKTPLFRSPNRTPKVLSPQLSPRHSLDKDKPSDVASTLRFTFAVCTDDHVTSLALVLTPLHDMKQPAPAPEKMPFSLLKRQKSNEAMTAQAGDLGGLGRAKYVIDLNPNDHRTPSPLGGSTWHIQIDEVPLPAEPNDIWLYTILVNTAATHVADPYARLLYSPCASEYGAKPALYPSMCVVNGFKDDFDWEGDQHLKIEREDLIIYEMHVRGFTTDESSGLGASTRGTYRGIVERADHLVSLGVTAVELLPIYEYNERECHLVDPTTRKHLNNYWGYCHESFFAPMGRYARRAGSAVVDFKYMVRELHKRGIAVILDVVYNHVGGPTFEFLARSNYFILSKGNHCNYTGCGNTFNCNNPLSADLIVNSLKYWAEEMHVDGFRFDLAPILGRGPDGKFLKHPPVIRRMFDEFSKPHLQHIALIMEPWDASDFDRKNMRTFWYGSRFAEWNGKYQSTLRDYIRGMSSNEDMGTRLAGSPDLYDNKHMHNPCERRESPTHGVNYATCHDGFSLMDLVSYDYKHNERNGEQNRDGMDHNRSWNCGVEGFTHDGGVQALRMRQIKNFTLMTMLARGIPMVLMGDEYGHTKDGNNNTWNHDNRLNWFLWNRLNALRNSKQDICRFFSMAIHLRRELSCLKAGMFLGKNKAHCLSWHAREDPRGNPFGHMCKFVALSMYDPPTGKYLYAAFNPDNNGAQVTVPHVADLARQHGVRVKDLDKAFWGRLVDTWRPSPDDFNAHPEKERIVGSYWMHPYSALVLISQLSR